MSERLVNPEALPPSLWDREQKRLVLPPDLATAYHAALTDAGLVKLSEQRDPNDPPVGGLTQEATDKHFAQAFDGSVARVELAVLDPKGELGAIPDAFIRCLSGNDVCLVDAPCGAGAATLSFLTTIAELRARGVLPRQPLDVWLIAAELSQPARERAEDMVGRVRGFLKSQAIFVAEEYLAWDVTSKMSNTDLVSRLVLRSESAAKFLLVIANFNGFLERDRKKTKAMPQLEELFRFGSASKKKNVAIWIEPNMKRATGLFNSLINAAKEAWRKFVNANGEAELEVLTSNSHFQDPIAPDTSPRVGLAVVQFRLERRS